MRKLSAALLVASTALMLSAGLALAANPPAAERSVVGGPGAHPHHVNTPAGCIDINAVTFEMLARGLHRGANESGPFAGPFHGPCPTE